MAYTTSNAPRLISGSLENNAPNLWVYSSTDAATAVRVSGYIANASDLGIKKGDLVFSVKTDAAPISCQIHIVSAVNANGSGDLSDGLAITATNSD
jgi:hypothetical protein